MSANPKQPFAPIVDGPSDPVGGDVSGAAPWLALPGAIRFDDGCRADYLHLQRYHYRQRPPATFAHVRVARYAERDDAPGRIVAAAVLSHPVPMLRGRMRHFAVPAGPYRVALRFANRGFLTVSRIVVHPQFRTLGLASELVRQLVVAAPSRYVESSATMARYGRFFERAGLTRIDPPDPDEPAYYLIDTRPNEPPLRPEDCP